MSTTRSLKIKDGLFLNKTEVERGVASKSVPQSVNHIWIIDRSGSMYDTLSKLIDDLQCQVERVKPSDTVSIGWFSSEGQFDWIVKGMAGSARVAICQMLDKYRYTVGATCFSDILKSVAQIIADLKIVSPVFSLMFMSDGHPVVRDFRREVKETMTALSGLREQLGCALFVGYGDYYNRELMADMAEKAGGALVHSGAMRQFSATFGQFVEASTTTRTRQRVELGFLPDFCFTLENEEVVLLDVQEGESHVYVGDADVVYTLSSRPEAKAVLNQAPEGLLGAATVFLQRARTNDALACLSLVGDVRLIKLASKAFTNADFGATEDAIKKAIFDTKSRFLEGQDFDFLPKPDAFCLIDALELLQEDEQAYFLPRHPTFVYKRIGVPSIPEPGYPKFVAKDDVRCPFSDFVWNDTRLNVSLKAKIEGTVDLGDEAAQFGFARTYPTWQFKNYTAIKDGILNITSLPSFVSRQTFATLQAEGMIAENAEWEDGKWVMLNFDWVPIINQAIAQGYKSAESLCRLAWREQELEAEIKVLKHRLEEIAPAAQRRTFAGLHPEQEAFLLSKGIGKNGFAPPSKAGEAKDSYIAKEFAIKIAGFSSLPSVNAVKEKLAKVAQDAADPSKKKKATLTPSQALMAGFLEKAAKLAQPMSIEETIKLLQGELAKVRQQIQRAKFAVILGREWFNEFPTRQDENTIEVDGHEFTFALREVTEEI